LIVSREYRVENEHMSSKNIPTRVAIACQGGGTHTAFTAGVLKRLLAEERGGYEVVALSGTSGGAICALLAWYALLLKGKEEANAGEKAAELLDSFWKRDISARSFDARVLNDSIVWLNRASEATIGVPVRNPYHLPHYPFSPAYWQNELRKMIEKNVHFEEIDGELVKPSSPRLFVSAVETLTGEFRVFRSHKPDEDRGAEGFVFNDRRDDGISVEAILASAAIPFLFEAVRIGEGVYWDGLYAQNPPIRHLTDLDPDEIWVIQINPEEISEEPKTTAEIWDRRNELAGNLSLNEELAFVRRTNDLVRNYGIEKPIIRVHRMEMSIPLDASSKLDRSPGLIEKLMDHGEEQATLFLETSRKLSALERAWEGKDVEVVMGLFAEDATIGFFLSPDSPAEEVRYRGKQQIRDLVKRGLKNNLSIEQARDHRLVAEEANCWLLVSADHLRTPAKGWAEAVVREDRIEALSFRPLNEGAKDGLRALAGP
jgi:NTE family protein